MARTDRSGPVFGAVADDLTGAVDLAAGLAAAGLRTRIYTSPDAFDPEGTEALVIALKTRTAPRGDAVELSLAAARALVAEDVDILFFKYCSTFDSTATGNIGPVTDALMELVGARVAVVAPGYPVIERTVYQGHLFVGDSLLSRSSMRHHPLTPMTESDVAVLMRAQSSYRVGKVLLGELRRGSARARFQELSSAGVRYAVVDTIEDGDLDLLADACRDHRLVTGGAGLAHALARRLGAESRVEHWRAPVGRGGILAGSCSLATLRQVATFARDDQVYALDPRESVDVQAAVDKAVRWALAQPPDRPFLIASSTDPAELEEIHASLGRLRAAELVERLTGLIAAELVAAGVSRLLIAGGETAGAVTAALGIKSMRVTLQIGPGLAWCETDTGVALALKSGNFGEDTVFRDAHDLLGATT